MPAELSSRRPVAVTIIAALYLAVGTCGFAIHFPASFRFHPDDILVEITEVAAVVCGLFLLRGQNWARWLALFWIAFHIVLSAFHAWMEFAMHRGFAGAIGWALFGSRARRYFARWSESSARSTSTSG